MPIRNLSDRKRVPRIGKIHLGIKKETASGTEYPAPTDYFVCPPEVQAVYGKEPKELRIMFVTNDPELAASQYLRSYKRTVGLVCRGDGYEATARLDVEALAKAKGEIGLGVWASAESNQTLMRQIPCAGEGYDGGEPCPAYKAGHCKRLMMLQFAVLGVKGLGVYQIDTSSVNGIQNVNGFLEFLRALTGGRPDDTGQLVGGRIAGIPLLLRLVPQEVSPEGKKKTVHVLKLDADFTMEKLVRGAQKPTVELLPPPPDEEVPEDFFPAEAAPGEPEGKAEPEAQTQRAEAEAAGAQPAAVAPSPQPERTRDNNPRPPLRGGTEAPDIDRPGARGPRPQNREQARFFAIVAKSFSGNKHEAAKALGLPVVAHTMTKNWLDEGYTWKQAADILGRIADGEDPEQARAAVLGGTAPKEDRQGTLEDRLQGAGAPPEEAE